MFYKYVERRLRSRAVVVVMTANKVLETFDNQNEERLMESNLQSGMGGFLTAGTPITGRLCKRRLFYGFKQEISSPTDGRVSDKLQPWLCSRVLAVSTPYTRRNGCMTRRSLGQQLASIVRRTSSYRVRSTWAVKGHKCLNKTRICK